MWMVSPPSCERKPYPHGSSPRTVPALKNKRQETADGTSPNRASAGHTRHPGPGQGGEGRLALLPCTLSFPPPVHLTGSDGEGHTLPGEGLLKPHPPLRTGHPSAFPSSEQHGTRNTQLQRDTASCLRGHGTRQRDNRGSRQGPGDPETPGAAGRTPAGAFPMRHMGVGRTAQQKGHAQCDPLPRSPGSQRRGGGAGGSGGGNCVCNGDRASLRDDWRRRHGWCTMLRVPKAAELCP